MSRILVGMSGGVDSSVAAALLARAGHEVIGVSLQLYDHSRGGRATRCCSPEDFLDARRVAAQCGFPYYVVDQEEVFSRQVLDYFVEEYRRGRTPNPCARCNADVKFTALARLAGELGAAALATGHYARLADDAVTGARRLLRAKDRRRDQSYFLFDVEPEHLAGALFPLGDLTKEQVRAEARALGLRGADKPDSQDVCFVEGRDYRDFLKERTAGLTPEAPGAIVDRSGGVLGRHEGISGFTVGQRRGSGVAAGKRLYVLDVNAATGQIVMGERDQLLCGGVTLTAARLRPGAVGDEGTVLTAQVRYRHAGVPATVFMMEGGAARVTFLDPITAVSPGQAAVLYDGDVVVGGGWIDATIPAPAQPRALGAA
jgi:tRNA-specific 2-thiouridylase